MKRTLALMAFAFLIATAYLIVHTAGWLVLLGVVVLYTCASVLVTAAESVK